MEGNNSYPLMVVKLPPLRKFTKIPNLNIIPYDVSVGIQIQLG